MLDVNVSRFWFTLGSKMLIDGMSKPWWDVNAAWKSDPSWSEAVRAANRATAARKGAEAAYQKAAEAAAVAQNAAKTVQRGANNNGHARRAEEAHARKRPVSSPRKPGSPTINAVLAREQREPFLQQLNAVRRATQNAKAQAQANLNAAIRAEANARRRAAAANIKAAANAKAATKIQAAFRGMLGRKQAAANLEKRRIRMLAQQVAKEARRRVMKRKENSVGHKAVYNYEALRRANIHRQKLREYAAETRKAEAELRRKAKEAAAAALAPRPILRFNRSKAATKIQAAFRGMQGRKVAAANAALRNILRSLE